MRKIPYRTASMASKFPDNGEPLAKAGGFHLATDC
jgi:hypothetical protein